MKEEYVKLLEEKRLCQYWIRNCKRDLKEMLMDFNTYKGCKKVLQDNLDKLQEVNNKISKLNFRRSIYENML